MGDGAPVGRAYGASLYGIEAVVVEVQAVRAAGVPRSTITGQAESDVKESRERIRVALQKSGLWKGDEGQTGAIINLAPAGVRKAGTGLDLPIALAVACSAYPDLGAGLRQLLGYAEVGLDGTLRPARGTLSAALAAREAGFRLMIVPPEAAREAAQVGGLEVLAVRTLRAVASLVRGDRTVLVPWPASPPPPPRPDLDLSDVKGQPAARRALEVAAAGGHNLLMIGPPGSGKTLLARRLCTIMPPLSSEEALEATRTHSAAGLTGPGSGLLIERPFRAPHHSISAAGLVGGGSPPRPGEISLAAHGVLFLDELPEFPRSVLDMLRQPLEDGTVVVVRASGCAEFPARFLLAAAMNPCPCGWQGSGVRDCRCTPPMVDRYRGRISGPLLDRIDLHVMVPAVGAADLTKAEPGETSAQVRARVAAAREFQAARNRRFGVHWNAHLKPKDLPAVCVLTPKARQALNQALERLQLSARAHDRILKVARTLADLTATPVIDISHIAEAVGYRTLDRTG